MTSEQLSSEKALRIQTIEIAPGKDVLGEHVAAAIQELGVAVQKVETTKRYYVACQDTLPQELFADGKTAKVTKTTSVSNAWIVEVRYKPGVMDPVQQSIIKTLSDADVHATWAATAQRYFLFGVSHDEVKKICKELLVNDLLQDVLFGWEILTVDPAKPIQTEENTIVKDVPLIQATDEELMVASKDLTLSLNLDEMKAVQEYFKELGRDPRDAEIQMIAQTWSEHCKHKIFTSPISYTENGVTHSIGSLMKDYIKKATSDIQSDWVVSVFHDNAGIVKGTDEMNVAFKVETHNHPSALDPYGGAGTGIGGVIRDVLGVGKGARPLFNTDVFCFAPPTTSEIPAGILHPRRILKGVVAGVRDYGNRMGIPTINGSITFHPNYLGAPLVFCGTAGIIPAGMEEKSIQPGDIIVVVGGRTGRDGIHGATFSSAALDADSATSAVQIGNPIEEKRVLDLLMQARDRNLYRSITDCGAGGFSSAIGEMAEQGCHVQLENAPVKYAGLSPWELWLSESQERMVLAVPQEKLQELLALCAEEDVEAAVLGNFTDSNKVLVVHKEKTVVELDVKFLHEGLPRKEKIASWKPQKIEEPELDEPDYGKTLLKMLGMPSIASKEWVIRQYDHEVQGLRVQGPFSGNGPSDASAVRIQHGKQTGVVVANGINPRYSAIDSYAMAACAIDEAMRNVVCAGGNPNRTALLDNFCWGTVNEESLGRLVRAVKACYDVATLYKTPFISGKDSFHNEFRTGQESISIPDTLLISALSIVENVAKTTSMDLKKTGNTLYIVGSTYNELGGSHYYELAGAVGKNVPIVRPEMAKKHMEQLYAAMQKGLVKSCHDCSEGGLGVALAEMTIAGDKGIHVNLESVPQIGCANPSQILFSESASRFIVEVGDEEAFEQMVEATKIGKVLAQKALVVTHNEEPLIDETIEAMSTAWRGALTW